MKRIFAVIVAILSLQTGVALAFEKNLIVYADDTRGTRFSNDSGKGRTYRLEALGSWLCANDGRGAVSANGYYIGSRGRNVAPHLPGCALVMRRSDNVYYKAGRDETFYLRSGDYIYLLMNDQHGKYGDNYGYLEVVIRRD